MKQNRIKTPLYEQRTLSVCKPKAKQTKPIKINNNKNYDQIFHTYVIKEG